MKILKQRVNTSVLKCTTVNDKIDVFIDKSYGPIFTLEDYSLLVFTDKDQSYKMLTKNKEIYDGYLSEINIDNLKTYLVESDDADTIYQNEYINHIELYMYEGLPIYRLITE